ncbi:hypothetical protein SKAU_G00091600 [Synaphobranchus kaupii]|uniref:Ubiquitin-like protease family profile domain-containing protein n=1 Tax=Synaphobranchus kaupii TaxID=118154 RepID=A0A9Q1FWY1_SYNKA|nr:hypothetical protein SKAU_G00091600 [Synaphobranchus kaupii]
MCNLLTLTNIWNGKQSRARHIDPNLFKLLLGVVNDNHHWTLVVIYPSERRTLYLNSLGESEQNMEKWFNKCVLWCVVCKYAECILLDKPTEFPAHNDAVKNIRRHIALTLLKESDWM